MHTATMTPSPRQPAAVHLSRNAHGRLVLVLADGARHEGVTPVRAFPIAAPAEGLSLVGQDGHELLWLDHLDHLPADARRWGRAGR